MAASKKYGLILSKNKAAGSSSLVQKATSSNIFGNDSDDEHDKSAIENMIKKASVRNLSKVQTQMTLKKALDEDATVFEYDEVFDEMKAQKEGRDAANKNVPKEKKPRYIGNLLANAAARKKEDERRAQRKIQREREEEKEEFGNKEAFVTSSYKKKMEEMQAEEQEAKRKEQLEEMMDVTKQRDLSGFYRHLLKRQCGEETVPDDVAPVSSNSAKLSEEKTSTKANEQNPDADSDFLGSSSSEDDEPKRKEKSQTTITGKSKGIAGRVYRKRKQRDDPDDEADHKGHKNSESEDTDESSDSSSSDGENVENQEKNKGVKNNESAADNEKLATQPKEAVPRKRLFKDWQEMFTKRCVGDKFEAARERYLERKAARQGVSVQ